MVAATMTRRHWGMFGQKAETLGILAFDACKTMCRLVSLYNSLSDKEINLLVREVIRSKGVTYLNSKEESFLLGLAAMERLGDLDEAAATVSRLGRRCSDLTLSRFDLAYNNLKFGGGVNLQKLDYGTRGAHKAVATMEKLVAATESLHGALESMATLEATEKKMQRWKTAANNANCKIPKPNLDYFNERMANQRKQVRHFKEVSLWNQSFDKTVGIMARVVFILYARICSVFGAYFSNSHQIKSKIDNDYNNSNVYCLIEHRELYQTNRNLSDQYEESIHKRGNKSGPLPKAAKLCDVKFYSGPIKPYVGNCGVRSIGSEKIGDVSKLAPPSTVGGAGLAVRYANVILFAERCLHAPSTVGAEARGELYAMLPERVRAKVRGKLRGKRQRGERELAEGWREAVEGLMEWLSPVAHDTVQWHAERHMERKRFEAAKTMVMLLQTLHYSDLEKAEAAIVEVLVGLSCIYWYERRR